MRRVSSTLGIIRIHPEIMNESSFDDTTTGNIFQTGKDLCDLSASLHSVRSEKNSPSSNEGSGDSPEGDGIVCLTFEDASITKKKLDFEKDIDTPPGSARSSGISIFDFQADSDSDNDRQGKNNDINQVA